MHLIGCFNKLPFQTKPVYIISTSSPEVQPPGLCSYDRASRPPASPQAGRVRAARAGREQTRCMEDNLESQ